ncbi:MAG TPA: deoxyribose-phosphate aldolase [Syntrophomonadaceae bacterium]|nr:deoxyribose-phosphate aldolase [Syntrophomonadaceae bacterium]
MLASYLDSTNLKSDSSRQDIVELCTEAEFYEMASVCVLAHRVSLASNLLKDTGVKTCTVIGFPLGADNIVTKVFATEQALKDGAEEIDMVINIGAVKDGDYNLVEKELQSVLELNKTYEFVLKVIVETALLTEKELINLIKLISRMECDYIKTSTGFATRGVSVKDIEIINQHKSEALKVKASGGIKGLDFALELINLGVDRIGTSSAKNIIEGMS